MKMYGLIQKNPYGTPQLLPDIYYTPGDLVKYLKSIIPESLSSVREMWSIHKNLRENKLCFMVGDVRDISLNVINEYYIFEFDM
jgi:hypothetical protein